MADTQEMLAGTTSAAEKPTVRVSYAADEYRRYPGEPVTLRARVTLGAAAARLRLSIDVPNDLEVTGFELPDSLGRPTPVTETADTRHIVWEIENGLTEGGKHEFGVSAVVNARRQNVDERETELFTVAEAIVTESNGTRFYARETLTLLIPGRARYLKYLPSIYRDDALLGQFLMMLESFWGPIDRQITSIHDDFDPRVMPSRLLAWYARWVDLRLDARWPEEKQRKLIRSIVSLYRRRGTRAGLAEFLELYTGVAPRIDERRARNLTLGRNALLGPSVALGTGNVPHSFSVTLRLPRVSDEESETRRNVIESIIDAEKPAHTSYTLEVFEY